MNVLTQVSQQDYAREYIRLSLLGVNNINQLQECTKVLPRETKFFVSPDQKFLDQWLAGGLPKLGKVLQDAGAITSSLLSSLGLGIFSRDTEMVERTWVA